MLLRILVFAALTAFWLLLLGGSSQAAGLPLEIGLAQLAPGIAALLMLLIFRRDRLRLSFAQRGIPSRRYLLAFAIPVAVGLLMVAISLILFEDFSFRSMGTGITPFALIWMPLGALGEELGWRGYLDKRLSQGMSGLWAAGITGVLWTFIHVHFYANGVLFLLCAILMFVAASFVIHAVVAAFDFDVILAFLFHLGINVSLSLAWAVIDETGFMALYALLWIIAAGITVQRRPELFFGRAAAVPTAPALSQS